MFSYINARGVTFLASKKFQAFLLIVGMPGIFGGGASFRKTSNFTMLEIVKSDVLLNKIQTSKVRTIFIEKLCPILLKDIKTFILDH